MIAEEEIVPKPQTAPQTKVSSRLKVLSENDNSPAALLSGQEASPFQ